VAYPGEGDEDEVAGEAEPDDTACLAVAVDLGENIAEDIAQGEDEYGRRQDDGAQADDLDGDGVGGDEAGDEDGGDDHQAVRDTHSFRSSGVGGNSRACR
jgi:hypothetical protein